MPEHQEDSVERLMELAGLTASYKDVFGKMRAPSEAAKLDLLKGLGFDPEDRAAFIPLAKAASANTPEVIVHWTKTGQETAKIDIPVDPPGGQWLLYRCDREGGAPERGLVADGTVLRLDLPVGIYRLIEEQGEEAVATTIVVAPDGCYLPPALEDQQRVWGVSVQLYSLRSTRNWGIGDYSDLKAFVAKAAKYSAALVGINPIHARSFFQPEEASPYAPVSRLALDTLAIDVEAVPELADSPKIREFLATPECQARLQALRSAPIVDYTGVAALKLEVLHQLHATFQAEGTPQRRAAYAAFVEQAGEGLRRYAEFEAIRSMLIAADGKVPPWWEWPQALRDRQASEFPSGKIQPALDFQLYLQFVARDQLAAVAEEAKRLGMPLGLYRDLAVAAARDSAEAWARPDIISKLSVGAAPDAFSQTGQNWGLPAPNPKLFIEEGFKSFAELVAFNMAFAGALRLDHAMALQRLFVIPDRYNGADGTYLNFPLDAMIAVVTMKSRQENCLFIGEALGTVPEGFEQVMEDRHILAYKIINFEVEEDRLKALASYPYLACAMFATHDMPTILGFWTERDLETRHKIEQLDDSAFAQAKEERKRERQRVTALLAEEGLMADPHLDWPAEGSAETLIAAIHTLLARSNSAIAMAQIDDILAEIDAVNIPGTATENPNWRRKLHIDLDDVAFDEAFARSAAIFQKERPGPKSASS